MHILSPYITWLLIFFITPIVILWLVAYPTLWRYKRAVINSVAISLAAGIPLDIFAIKTHTWGWDKTCCALPRVGGMPLEEILFGTFAAILISTVTLIAREIYLNHKKGAR